MFSTTKVNIKEIQKILNSCHSQLRSLPYTDSHIEQAQYHIFQAIYSLSHYKQIHVQDSDDVSTYQL